MVHHAMANTNKTRLLAKGELTFRNGRHGHSQSPHRDRKLSMTTPERSVHHVHSLLEQESRNSLGARLRQQTSNLTSNPDNLTSDLTVLDHHHGVVLCKAAISFVFETQFICRSIGSHTASCRGSRILSEYRQNARTTSRHV